MTKRILRMFAVLVVVVLSAAACHRRPLYDPETSVKVRVKVNVKAICNITEGTKRNTDPRLYDKRTLSMNTDEMHVLVYYPDTRNLYTQTWLRAKTMENGEQVLSGDLAVDFGEWDIVIYNWDTQSIQKTGFNSESTMIAYTDEIPSSTRVRYLGTKADAFDGIGIYEEPEHLFVAHKDVMVAPRDTVIVIDTEAQTVIDTYYLQIRVKGIQHATTNANAVISGLSPSNRFALNLRTEDPSGAVCFPLIASKDTTITDEPNDVMCAVFNTFGKIPEVTSNLHATFSVVDTGGNLQTLDVNLDDVFKKKEAIENHWLIIDQVIWEIEDPNVNPQPGGNGGFQPIVDDWEEEHGEIIL